MKSILFLILCLSGLNTFAFNLNDGSYVSKEGCEASVATYSQHKIFPNGTKFIEFKFNLEILDPKTGLVIEEVYNEGTKIINASYDQILKSYSLCGDEEINMPSANLVEKTEDQLEFQCGGFFDAIDENFKIKTSKSGDLTELAYVLKIALLSNVTSIVSGPKTTKTELSCTEFTKIN